MSKRMILVDADTIFSGGQRNCGPMPFDEVRAYKKIKKMLKKEEEEKKKTAPPKGGGLFPNWSVAQKTAFFTIFGPPLGIAYVFSLVILVRGLSSFIVGGIH